MNKIAKITISIILFLFFAVSLYFNYLYLKDYIKIKGISSQKNAVSTNVKSDVLGGVIISVDNNTINIKVENMDNEEKLVKTDNETKYSKTWIDTESLLTKTINVDPDYLKKDMVANIYLTENSTENNYLAKEVNIVVQNSFTGTLKSINNDSVKIELIVFSQGENNNTNSSTDIKELKLNNNTKYYKLLNSNTDTDNQFSESTLKLQEISFNDFQVNKNVMAVVDDIYINNNSIVLKLIDLNN